MSERPARIERMRQDARDILVWLRARHGQRAFHLEVRRPVVDPVGVVDAEVEGPSGEPVPELSRAATRALRALGWPEAAGPQALLHPAPLGDLSTHDRLAAIARMMEALAR